MAIGIRLKKILKEKNTTVAELSRQTGIKASTLYSIIRRDSESMAVEDLAYICDFFDVPMEFFTDDSYAIQNFEKRFNIKVHRLVEALDQLNDPGQEKVTTYAEDLTKVPEYQRTQNENAGTAK